MTAVVASLLTPLSAKETNQKSSKVKPYPLKMCIVSDEELGSMGDYITFVYKDQQMKVCCKPCIKQFKKDPKKYIKLLAKEVNKLKKNK